MKPTSLSGYARFLHALVALLLVTGAAWPSPPAAQAAAQALPGWIERLRLPEPVTPEGSVDLSELRATGRQEVVVQLTGEALSALAAARATADAQAAQAVTLQSQQADLIAAAQALDPQARVLTQLNRTLNAVVFELDVQAARALASRAGVLSVKPVRSYQLALSESVPGIGVTPAVRSLAADGADVRVAVFDTGIDFTHAKLGGWGTLAAYNTAYCGAAALEASPFDPACAGHAQPPVFNDKVVGGYDFVGEAWPNGPLAPDPNPLDFNGHGTHVADIIGGAPVPDPARARVRLALLAPDAPPVNFLINGVTVVVSATANSVSAYATVPPGPATLQIVAADTGALLREVALTAEAGRDYTAAATGRLAGLQMGVFDDDNTNLPAAARVRLVHGAPDTGAVDVAPVGGAPIISGLAFGARSAYLALPAGVYTLEIRQAGTANVLATLTNLRLEAGQTYTAWGMTAASLSAQLTTDGLTAGGGVAPGVALYAVKVCSAIATSCSGVALLQAMEYAVDPNGDGDLSDRMHIINMSLGSDYGGAYDDPLSVAVNNASALGVLVVAAAGNGGDKPFVTGTPGSALTALSVAQTHLPGDRQYQLRIEAPAAIAGLYANTAAVSWAPVGPGFGGEVAYLGRGCPGDPIAVKLEGQVALIDRGGCAVSLKVDRAAQLGASGVLIGLTAAGPAISFGFGGGTQFVPTLVIDQDTANRLRTAGAAAAVRVDPADAFSLAGSMVSTSARGPNPGAMFYGNEVMYGQLIKPEIGAPGASISAVAGTGATTAGFGGTSGATPMVAGAAALLMNTSNWSMWQSEIKARLMNTASTDVYYAPVTAPGVRAPITAIGGGEVRVDRAVQAQATAWELNNRSAALSFGLVNVARPVLTLRRTVVVRNYGDQDITYAVAAAFRDPADAASGAVRLDTPSGVRVPARGQRTFEVTLTIDGLRLSGWQLNSGANGASGAALTAMEYDGYLWLTDSANPANNLHLPWHVLPRLSSDLRPSTTALDLQGAGTGSLALQNRGVGPAYIDGYTLVAVSDMQAAAGAGQNRTVVDLKAVGVRTFPVSAGFCSPQDSFLLAFAISTHYPQTHANAPGMFEVNLDLNRDGVDDYQVFNFDLGLPALSDGRNAVWVLNRSTGAISARFLTEHAAESGNMVLVVCAEQVGLTQADLGRAIDFQVEARDWYNSGAVTDSTGRLVIRPGGERFVASGGDVAAGATAQWTITDRGAAGTNPADLGVLLFVDAPRPNGTWLIRSGAPDRREALVIEVAP